MWSHCALTDVSPSREINWRVILVPSLLVPEQDISLTIYHTCEWRFYKETFGKWIIWSNHYIALRAQNTLPLQWRHYGQDSVWNHQPYDCLLNRLLRRRSKKTSKLRVTGLCVGNSPGTGEFPAQMASNAENVSIGWRNHDKVMIWTYNPHYGPLVGESIVYRRLSDTTGRYSLLHIFSFRLSGLNTNGFTNPNFNCLV